MEFAEIEPPKRLRHKWIKSDKDKLDKYDTAHKCSVCDCLKHKSNHNLKGFRYTTIQCSRNNVVFENDFIPDCINWEEENEKTID